MLADEVGLGKSIEALVVLSYAIKMGKCGRAWIIVPDQLIYQWKRESNSKFELDAETFMLSSFLKKKIFSSVNIISFSDFARYYDEYLEKYIDDFVIVDELHKALKDRKLYNC